jgi:hypothetical protein
MAKINFVGFQEHVEIPEGHQLVAVEEEIESSLDRDQLFSLLSEPTEISRWFVHVSSLQSKQGGKVIYVSEDGSSSEVVCTSYDSGKEISLLSSEFGNYSAKVVGRKELSVKISFRILTDAPAEAKKKLEGYVANLRGLISS